MAVSREQNDHPLVPRIERCPRLSADGGQGELHLGGPGEPVGIDGGTFLDEELCKVGAEVWPNCAPGQGR